MCGQTGILPLLSPVLSISQWPYFDQTLCRFAWPRMQTTNPYKRCTATPPAARTATPQSKTPNTCRVSMNGVMWHSAANLIARTTRVRTIAPPLKTRPPSCAITPGAQPTCVATVVGLNRHPPYFRSVSNGAPKFGQHHTFVEYDSWAMLETSHGLGLPFFEQHS